MVFAYFQCKVFENTKSAIDKASKNKINSSRYPYTECIKLLNEKGIDWENIPKAERFGVFYKYDAYEKKIVTLSEMIRVKDSDKYLTFLFNL